LVTALLPLAVIIEMPSSWSFGSLLSRPSRTCIEPQA
jgi:hypothetical protein